MLLEPRPPRRGHRVGPGALVASRYPSGLAASPVAPLLQCRLGARFWRSRVQEWIEWGVAPINDFDLALVTTVTHQWRGKFRSLGLSHAGNRPGYTQYRVRSTRTPRYLSDAERDRYGGPRRVAAWRSGRCRPRGGLCHLLQALRAPLRGTAAAVSAWRYAPLPLRPSPLVRGLGTPGRRAHTTPRGRYRPALYSPCAKAHSACAEGDAPPLPPGARDRSARVVAATSWQR